MTMRHRPHSNGQKAESFIFVLTVEHAKCEMYYASGFSDFKMNALYDRVVLNTENAGHDKDFWSLWLCAESDPNRDKLLRTTNPRQERPLAPPTQDNPDC